MAKLTFVLLRIAMAVGRQRGRGHAVNTHGAPCIMATKFHPVRGQGILKTNLHPVESRLE